MNDITEYIVRETGFPGAIKQEVVREVVRCEKCKHWRKNISDVETCRVNREIDGSERETRPDFFCADGERREDE